MYPEPVVLASIMTWIERPAQVIATIIGVGFLVFVHELGHFLVAKWNGVKVERFAIGLGKKLVGFTWGETEYVLCPIPFGGYVKMAGEYPNQEHTGADYEFFSKPPGKRALIVVAGVVVNAIVAIPLFIVAFRIGVWLDAPEVDPIPGRAAWTAGLREGDVILEINGEEINDFGKLRHLIAFSKGDVTIKARRNDEILTFEILPEEETKLGIRAIGVAPRNTLVVAVVGEGMRAEESGIRKRDILTEADGEELISWRHFERVIRESPGKPVSLTLIRSADGTESRIITTVIPESVRGWELGCLSGNDLYIDKVQRGSPAWEAGIRNGDRVVSLNGSQTGGGRNFIKTIAASKGKMVTLGIRRQNSKINVSLYPEYDPADNRAFMGVIFRLEPVVGEVSAGSPAEEMGLKPGDRIVSVKPANRKHEIEIETWSQFVRQINNSEGKSVTVSWGRGKEIMTGVVTPRRNEDLAVGFVGLASRTKLTRVQQSFSEAVRSGVVDSYVWGKRIVVTFFGILSGTISTKAVMGPVMLPVVGMWFAERGLGTFLYFLGMLGVNFAVLNLIIPLPVVDGGLLILLGLEKLRGKILSLKTQTIINHVSYVILITIAVLITVQDVGNLSSLFGWFGK